jgi:serine/threonine-protein kinase
MAEAVTHPNLVQILEHGQDEDQCFLIMEYVNGSTLEDHLQRTEFPTWKALSIAGELCVGVAHAHQHGLTHGDIKPRSVLLRSDGVVKLSGLGLVELRNRFTATRGTPFYLAPEQFLAQPIGPRTDVYSLGCTIYELLTGRPPFVGDNLRRQHLESQPRAPSRFARNLPSGIDELIARCLAKEPRERPESAEEVRNALMVVERGLT